MTTNRFSMRRTTLAALSILALTYLASASAEKQLTIAAPGYEKTITLDEDPELIISYTPNGMKINFTNLNMKVVCIEDPSADGLCRLQAYDGSIGGGSAGVPSSPAKPSATPADGSVTLTWVAPEDNGSAIVGYKIEQRSPSNTTIESNTGNANTSYTVSGLTNGTAYTFAVAAINGIGLGYMSPSSDAVTPVSSGGGGGGGGGGGSTVGTACNTVTGNVNCSVVGDGILASGVQETISIPQDRTLTFPFSLDASTATSGAFTLTSFYNVDGSIPNTFFEIWLSDSPAGATDLNGSPVNGSSSTCYGGAQYAELSLTWSRGAAATGGKCYLGATDATGLVWLNMRFRNVLTGSLERYGTTYFSVD